jgi:hypothetical protein
MPTHNKPLPQIILKEKENNPTYKTDPQEEETH